jgi:chemotaxis signal transduction protein
MASDATSPSGAATHLLVRCGETFCALPLASIRRVTGRLEVQPLPGSRAELAGLCEFAGEPLPMLDLGRLVGDPAASASSSTATVVAWAGRGAERSLVGLAVDEALELVEVPREAIVAGAGGLRAGETNLGGRAVRVLDLEAIA